MNEGKRWWFYQGFPREVTSVGRSIYHSRRRPSIGPATRGHQRSMQPSQLHAMPACTQGRRRPNLPHLVDRPPRFYFNSSSRLLLFFLYWLTQTIACTHPPFHALGVFPKWPNWHAPAATCVVVQVLLLQYCYMCTCTSPWTYSLKSKKISVLASIIWNLF